MTNAHQPDWKRSTTEALSDCSPARIATGDPCGMARLLHSSPADTVAHGEVWTDARGYATVRLPAGVGRSSRRSSASPNGKGENR